MSMMTLAQVHAMLPTSKLINISEEEAKSLRLSRVGTDSRQIEVGELFIALAGERFDAHEFLEQVANSGAGAALINNSEKCPANLPAVCVANTRTGLGDLAKAWRSSHSIPLALVSGSNGKTTVKEMIASIFKAAAGEAHTLVTKGNLNNEIGLPLTLLKLRSTDRLAVVELGMNHPGETAQLAAIAQANIALINNAQREHQEFMATVEAVAKEHGLAIENLPADGTAVFPADSEYTSYWKNLAGNRTTLDFALNAPATVSGEWLNASANQLKISTPQGSMTVRLQILGEHNAKNALAATAVAIAAGIPLEIIQLGLEKFEPVTGRMQKHQINSQTIVIDDSYNANPDSVRAAVDVLSTINMPAWLVLGDMGEVGEQGPEFHREVGSYAGEKGIQKLFATGDLSKEAVMAYRNTPNAQGTAQHFSDVQDLCVELKKSLVARSSDEETTILVKGSRFMRMERVVKALAEEIH